MKSIPGGRYCLDKATRQEGTGGRKQQASVGRAGDRHRHGCATLTAILGTFFLYGGLERLSRALTSDSGSSGSYM